jgi:molecular chaperone Hsp33
MACLTTDLVNEAAVMHGTYPTASAALGRALTGCELMASLLDPEQRVALKFEGDGPLGKVVAEADGTGAVRGYVADPRVDLPPRNGKLDVSGAIGRNGFLTVSKDLGLKEPYRGIVRFYNAEVASDMPTTTLSPSRVPSAVGKARCSWTRERPHLGGGRLPRARPCGGRDCESNRFDYRTYSGHGCRNLASS